MRPQFIMRVDLHDLQHWLHCWLWLTVCGN